MTSYNDWQHLQFTGGSIGGSMVLTGAPIQTHAQELTLPEARIISSLFALFLRGDANASNAVDIADAIFILSYLFAEGTTPSCIDAADANDSGSIDIADGILILSYLFANAGPLPEPLSTCGIDPTADDLDCASFAPCRQP